MAEIKLWTDGVEVEDEAMAQIRNVASLPIVAPHVAVMPDVHWGIGATVGSVIPTRGAIIPAAVGVDLGCGMMAVRTTWRPMRSDPGEAPRRDRGRDSGGRPRRDRVVGPRRASARCPRRFEATGSTTSRADGRTSSRSTRSSPAASRRTAPTVEQLGTLGTGNHFIEVCLDPRRRPVWLMLHSGSRGLGNRIGTLLHRARQGRDGAATRTARFPDPNLA